MAQDKSWKAQLQSEDIDDLLSAAEFMARKLDAPSGDLYGRWLESALKEVRPSDSKLSEVIQTLAEAGVPICTLNYDTLLEFVTGLPTVTLRETGKVAAWMRKESASILHLHGAWDVPSTCVLGIRDYATTVGDSVRDLIQRSLGSFHRLLFVGCGDTFSDPNFSALIRWLRDRMGTAAPAHYALVLDRDVSSRQADPAWQGFVDPVGYGPRHSALPDFLLRYVLPTGVMPSNKTVTEASPTPQNAKVLQDYRAFLVRDCGQMTIEGVRADMDTAQRKFDLERLFVPLQVLPSPPEIPDNDPNREQKLLAWKEKNSKPRPFGKVFAKHKRLALLALPGGGKTLLLKRLTVAYSDVSRRAMSEDALPQLNLFPVLIRCREWREHIHKPVSTLLQSIPEITGQTNLLGLSDALTPLFKGGNALLLIDGLDEIHDDALRSTFVEHLEAFLGDYPLVRTVVTSREAGFSLVAPCLARFCERWRVAPLEDRAIKALCNYWHRLMTGDSPEATAEAEQVSLALTRNDALRRLAENPLLLTMLLVVKHGAGRLPPDRVSLYGRAVEVLLDTWNIKGHDPLNPKEAVPQLACVAFQLMRYGKQTATAKELLSILEEARERVPQIRRYAKDTPQEFLKRVELRSSLLVEGGRQADGKNSVPFYQFRHLTFQEYLAAVAAVEGHYMDYEKSDSVLTPLEQHLTSEEWKEVIPMSAVLARKQAEPIMTSLVARGKEIRALASSGSDFPGRAAWMGHPPKMPAPVSRLIQCLVEEAEAAPETLTAVLQLIVFFAKGCRGMEDWRSLSRGPYGEELLHQAWLLYSGPEVMREEIWAINTFSALAALQFPANLNDKAGHTEVKGFFDSTEVAKISQGLGILAGQVFTADLAGWSAMARYSMAEVERLVFNEELPVWTLAVWVWTLIRVRTNKGSWQQPSTTMIDRLSELFFRHTREDSRARAAFALTTICGLRRDLWKPSLSESQIEELRKPSSSEPGSEGTAYIDAAKVLIAFHAQNVFSESELASRLAKPHYSDHIMNSGVLLEQMGPIGKKELGRKRATPRA